jgi:hypothetical protein
MLEANRKVEFAMTRFHVSRRWNLALVLIALLTATPSWAQNKVTLQLKWLHEFQFAGYYAALQQGYYRAAGFDVDIRPGGPTSTLQKPCGTARLSSGFARPACCWEGRKIRRSRSSA